MVAIQKAAKLQAKLLIKTWLKDLKALTAPSENVIKQSQDTFRSNMKVAIFKQKMKKKRLR